MISYIEATCHPIPLNSHPEYNEDADMWDVWFEEKKCPNPYNLPFNPVCVGLNTLEEAQELIQKALELAYEGDDAAEELETAQ